jgi:aspartate-semialdehyde dehydrogenase
MKHVGAVSIVGGESLIGRELRDLIAEQRLPVRVNLIGVDDGSMTLTEQAGEPVVITPLDEENLSRSELVILAGSKTSSAKALALAGARAGGPTLVDMTYAADQMPFARLRAPMVEPPDYSVPAGTVHVIAHPAAIVLALFLLRLGAKFPVRRWSAHIFEPASERGEKGVEEIRQQTISLLSFKPMPKQIFDAQASFNLLARYGDDAPQSLEAVQLRIERHLAILLGGRSGAPMPSIRLVHAPVFHGYSISVYVEFKAPPDVRAVADALSSDEVDVRGGDLEPPNNVAIAGLGGIAVGAISPDRNSPKGCWFWVVADNFRLKAENAVAVARSLLPAPDEAR